MSLGFGITPATPTHPSDALLHQDTTATSSVRARLAPLHQGQPASCIAPLEPYHGLCPSC